MLNQSTRLVGQYRREEKGKARKGMNLAVLDIVVVVGMMFHTTHYAGKPTRLGMCDCSQVMM